jgi:hypothetical protein
LLMDHLAKDGGDSEEICVNRRGQPALQALQSYQLGPKKCFASRSRFPSRSLRERAREGSLWRTSRMLPGLPA